jgi:putative hemolysin
MLAYTRKETVLRGLLYFVHVGWIFVYPMKIFFSRLQKENQTNDKEPGQEDLSEEALEVFFEEGTRDGVIEEEDQEMIESVLEFGDILVKEIMTPRVDMEYITLDTTLPDLISFIKEKKKSRYPVIRERIDEVEGIILAKDIFNYWTKKNFNIKEILRKPYFIPETMRVIDLLKDMQKLNQKFAIVVDEFGGISGVVTMEDIIEEIVGEIKDEYDIDEQPIVKEKDFFIVNGEMDVSEIAEVLNIKIDEDEDYQTVAGLISHKLGKIPNTHDCVTIGAFTFEVLEVDKNRIRKVKIYSEKKIP